MQKGKKKTQKSNKKGKTSLASLCTNEKTKQQISRKTRQKKKVSALVTLCTIGIEEGGGEREWRLI